MDITVIERPSAQATVVALRDQLDIGSVARLHTTFADLLDRSVTRIVVDLSGLTFCDSIGLSALIVTYNACASMGGYLRIAGAPPFLLHMLTVLGLREQLPIYRSAKAAYAGEPAGLLTADDAVPRLRAGH
jgi:anti-sigma B factor antagonist